MSNVYNNIVNDVYSTTPAPTSQPQPKRKNAVPRRWRKPDGQVEKIAEQLDTQSLVNENDRLHEMQQELRRRKFLGLA